MAINLLGGVKLPKNNENLQYKDITEIKPPEVYAVPVVTSNGLPAEPVVKIGDEVEEGQLIVKPTGSRGSFVYSPTCGKVVSIIDKFTPKGKKIQHIIIKNNGKLTTHTFSPLKDKTAKELLKRLALCGLVDANFGGTPTYLRYTLSAIERKFTLYVVISNTDPYISSNEALVINRTAEVVGGAKYFAKILASKKIVFVYNGRAKKTKKLLKKYLKAHEPQLKCSFKEISNNYPSDNIMLLMHRFKTKTKLFTEGDYKKAFVEDAITCYNFFNAVEFNMPVNSRVVTVGGNNIDKKGNYIVKNGTSFEHILNVVGTVDDKKPFKILNGGIMTGMCQYTTDVSCNLETRTVSFINESEFDMQDESPCINCGRCVSVCPMNLVPNVLDDYCVNRKHFDAEKHGLKNCIECGCCSYVCPSKRYLTQRISTVKKQVEGGDK